MFEMFTPAALAKAREQWILSPKPGPKHPPVSILTKLFGFRSVPDLGLMTTSLLGATNAPLVERSGGLLDYGSKFRYGEFISVRNRLFGAAVHLSLALAAIVLAMPPARWLLRKFSYAAGDGPSRDNDRTDHAEFHGIAKAATEPERRVFGRLRWEGTMYNITGAFLAVGAIILAREDTTTEKLGGGILTPACLGQSYIERMRDAGLVIETRLMD